MENINQILGRDQIANTIKTFLTEFDKRSKDVAFMKGVYIYGSHGSGKTQFIIRLLEQMNYDIIRYDAGDVRNSSMIDTITSNTISNRNVLSMMRKTTKRKVIVMDEIDGMNSGDKGGLSSLIKLIRQKKTKKQKTEEEREGE
jgi:replication factor C subunit 1